jgi:hypothetical protein
MGREFAADFLAGRGARSGDACWRPPWPAIRLAELAQQRERSCLIAPFLVDRGEAWLVLIRIP